jgi:HD superfamily phosphohydrolase
MCAKAKSISDRNSPNYIGWRGELLAKLALSRLSNLTITEQPREGRFDFSVMTNDDFDFLIEVKAFSSMRQQIRDIETFELLRWQLPTVFLQKAKSMRCPVVLFLFDADTEHGRFLRVDNLELRSASARFQSVRFPRENTITKESLERMLRDLRSSFEHAPIPPGEVKEIIDPAKPPKQIHLSTHLSGSSAVFRAKAVGKSFRFTDPIHGELRLSGFEVALLDTPWIQRLRNCLMHPTTHLVYPSMTHSRFTHTLGLLAIVNRFLTNVFSDQTNKKALERSSQRSAKELLAFARVAALIHDIGHYPFKVVGVVNENLATISNATDKIETLWRHQFLTKGGLSALIDQGLPGITGGLNSGDLAGMFAKRTNAFLWLSDLLDGTFGADLVDNMMRDAFYAGSRMTFDVQQLAKSLEVKLFTTESGENVTRLRLNNSATREFYSYIMCRYYLYERIYLHRTVRGFETHWDRFCSSLNLDVTSEADFLRATGSWLAAKAGELAGSSRDAHAIVNRDPFKFWRTGIFLGEMHHEKTLEKLTEMLANVSGKSTIDHESFMLISSGEKSSLPKEARSSKLGVIDQIRVVAETDVTTRVEKVGLKIIN